MICAGAEIVVKLDSEKVDVCTVQCCSRDPTVRDQDRDRDLKARDRDQKVETKTETIKVRDRDRDRDLNENRHNKRVKQSC